MSRWVVLKRRVGAVTSQRVVKVLFYVNILQCFFVVENFTANAVSVAIGDDAVEDYARRWKKREVDQDPELESLSDWVRKIRSLVQGRIHKLKNCVNSRPKSVFKDQEAVKCPSFTADIIFVR
jgi:hypothetical protein